LGTAAETEEKNSEYQPATRIGTQLARHLRSLRIAAVSGRGMAQVIAESVNNQDAGGDQK
jgi:hypothetical protein